MNIQTRQSFLSIPVLAVFGILGFISCGNGSSSSGQNGGTNAREFISGDLAPGQSFTHVFSSAKVVPYYCRYHGGPNGAGMSGIVTVGAGGTPSSTNVDIISSSLPDLTIDVGDTVTWNNRASITHTVESDN